MFYTTEQPHMSLPAIIISAKRIMRLTTHDLLIKNLSQVATADTFNLSENVRSESDAKRVINFNIMENKGRFWSQTHGRIIFKISFFTKRIECDTISGKDSSFRGN
jgi:hypothetical protein